MMIINIALDNIYDSDSNDNSDNNSNNSNINL